MLIEKFQTRINELYSYSGYERQAALNALADCFEPMLFSHLLVKLSDYVAVNRQLAAQHLLRWAERPEISTLCIDYFLDLLAIKKRIRLACLKSLLLKA